MTVKPYIGRFAPSPTGALHAGSLVAALASWLDARAHGGRWLLRIEDTDTPRCVCGADREILRQLDVLGLHPDEPPLWQSQREAFYQQALDGLVQRGLAYACGCTRRDIDAALQAQGHAHQRHEERVYPGTCRDGLHGKPARAWRLRCGTEAAPVRIAWHDRRLGAQAQDLTHQVGDFVLRRADGIWAYQLAVVVDDALQGVTHVVRGEDLADNTPRQIWLQRQLGAPQPAYLHLPLVRDARGEKLSKQHGAPPLALDDPLAALQAAAQALELPRVEAGEVVSWLSGATAAWARRWAIET
ncbi:tRNA glutamyl-Q(34) synthetase GluQRS [Azohydromonas caseinilytica]|uniref:tRNA glutamyl-Q(34) synthetase GluQRS n=1 Tax=Azohydromonas caseinilytica TaxID=2728836 RepID=UPI002873A825|nr:tRNA glutamyl-Q(34) synthetase GluQRS [Azohydromonas caseinilytica]